MPIPSDLLKSIESPELQTKVAAAWDANEARLKGEHERVLATKDATIGAAQAELTRKSARVNVLEDWLPKVEAERDRQTARVNALDTTRKELLIDKARLMDQVVSVTAERDSLRSRLEVFGGLAAAYGLYKIASAKSVRRFTRGGRS